MNLRHTWYNLCIYNNTIRIELYCEIVIFLGRPGLKTSVQKMRAPFRRYCDVEFIAKFLLSLTEV